MHLYSLYRGSEDGEVYVSDEGHLAAYLLQLQRAQSLHVYSTCKQYLVSID